METLDHIWMDDSVQVQPTHMERPTGHVSGHQHAQPTSAGLQTVHLHCANDARNTEYSTVCNYRKTRLSHVRRTAHHLPLHPRQPGKPLTAVAQRNMRWRRHPQALTFSGRSGHTSADPVASTLYFPLSVLPPVVFPLFQVCSAAPNARGDKIGQPRQPTPLFLVHTFFPSRPPSTSTKPLVNISGKYHRLYHHARSQYTLYLSHSIPSCHRGAVLVLCLGFAWNPRAWPADKPSGGRPTA